MASPRVTVLIANYNGKAFLARAVDSALSQSLPPDEFEIVVADDGSTDDSPKLIEGYGDSVRLLRLSHGGLAAARNAGIKASLAPRILPLDADDELEPGALAELCAEFDRNPEAAYVSADRTDIEAATGKSAVFHAAPDNMYDLIAPGVLFDKDKLHEVGLYNDLYWEEYDLFLRLLLKWKPRHIPKPLYRYYRHGQNMTANPENRIKGWEVLIEKWGIEMLRRFGRCPELEETYGAIKS